MNERTKELAERAELEFDDDCSLSEDPIYYITQTQLEKFAELIVQECADIVENKIGVSRYIHEAELLRECSATIKEHFGVKL